MIVYEINLTIDMEIISQFEIWLKEHIKEMLQFPGFIEAAILKPEFDSPHQKEALTVQYLVENREFLEHYFIVHAEKMREKGLISFKNKFSAERRIFERQTLFYK